MKKITRKHLHTEKQTLCIRHTTVAMCDLLSERTEVDCSRRAVLTELAVSRYCLGHVNVKTVRRQTQCTLQCVIEDEQREFAVN